MCLLAFFRSKNFFYEGNCELVGEKWFVIDGYVP